MRKAVEACTDWLVDVLRCRDYGFHFHVKKIPHLCGVAVADKNFQNFKDFNFSSKQKYLFPYKLPSMIYFNNKNSH